MAIEGWNPSMILYDLVLPEMNAMEFLKKIQRREIPYYNDCPVMVLSSHNAPENVKACIHAGAADFVVKPVSYQDVLSRLAFHMQRKRQIAAVSADSDKKGEYFLYLTELILKKALCNTGRSSDLVFDLLQMQAMAISAVRCSLVEINHELMTGTVLRSSDDRNFGGFCLQLQKYPEITTVMQTEKLVAIDDLSGNEIMAKVKSEFKSISFNSMVVCPVLRDGEVYGVVSARRHEDAETMTDAEIRFCQVIASVIGVVLKFDKSLQNLIKAA